MFGWQQQLPTSQGFQQLDDAHNPAAQAYARQVLATNGIHPPPGADAAAIWRAFSAQRAALRAQALASGPVANDAIPMGSALNPVAQAPLRRFALPGVARGPLPWLRGPGRARQAVLFGRAGRGPR